MVIIFVEDQSLIRLLLQMAVGKILPKAQVYGADSLASGLALCKQHAPDLVMLDLVLPDGEGIDLVPQIRELAPQAKIVGMSGHLSNYILHRLLEAKVDGFIDKGEQGVEVISEAITTVVNGGIYFSQTARQMQERMRADTFSFTKLLSNREMQLMIPFGEGLSDAEVSEKTGIKASTVRNHRQNIMTKLNLNSTRQLIRYAIENGFAH